jgi:hypothetical protein
MRITDVIKRLLSLASLTLVAFSLHAEDSTLHIFKKIWLSDKYWSDAPAIGDLNRDGHTDIVVGPYWFEGPRFKIRHELYPATKTFTRKKADGTEEAVAGFDGALGSGETVTETDSIFTKIVDLNGDGWPDVLVVGASDWMASDHTTPPSRTLSWYENPGRVPKGSRSWKRHVIAVGVDNESVDFVDLFGDGKSVLICMSGGYTGYLTRDPWDGTRKWTFHAISQHADEFGMFTHALGYGDLNGDGRNDILHSDGWWEQPESIANEPVWPYHPYPFQLGPHQLKQSFPPIANIPGHKRPAYLYDVDGDGVPTLVTGYGGSQMSVADVNGDGLPDVITSLNAHGYGLVWWQQLKKQSHLRDLQMVVDPGSIEFKRNIIINKEPSENKYGVEFSEMQAVTFADIDGDGLKDIVTGKWFWSHGNEIKFPGGIRARIDPEPNSPAVLYWFKQVHNADASIDFVPHLIDDNSGAGTQIAVGDVDGDGRPDIVVANKKGAFVFLQEAKIVSREEWKKAQPPILFPTL